MSAVFARHLRRVCSRRLTTAAPDLAAIAPRPEISASTPQIQKLVDDIGDLTLLQASEFVKLLRVHLSISEQSQMMAVPPIGAGAGGAAAEAAPVTAEKTAFTVKLTGFDAANKVKTIKEVRAITKLGLKEAKALVESAPVDIVKDCNKVDAQAIFDQLVAIGAKVEMA